MVRPLVVLVVLLNLTCLAHAETLDRNLTAKIDEVAQEWLLRSQAPSVSIAVVQGASPIYAKAYGSASLNPRRAATSHTRYAIHSVSKQFTAAAILLLAEQGKLSLDDKIERWFPDLGVAGQVTIRQILTHTAGVRDFWRWDFPSPEMLRATTPAAIMAEWATQPLDFDPGSDHHYSNTGYVIAGAIVEKVSGEELFPFLQAHIFAPLKMDRVT
jgi:CubicO group peptidase (beta-lactamase class C family)